MSRFSEVDSAFDEHNAEIRRATRNLIDVVIPAAATHIDGKFADAQQSMQ